MKKQTTNKAIERIEMMTMEAIIKKWNLPRVFVYRKFYSITINFESKRVVYWGKKDNGHINSDWVFTIDFKQLASL